MPLYEYRCRKCGHVMEVLQKLSDPPVRKCDQCGSRVDKMISRTAFQLKGEGWFAQGYSGSEGKKKKKSDAAPAASDAKESKPSPGTKETGDSSSKKSEPGGGGSTKAAVAGG